MYRQGDLLIVPEPIPAYVLERGNGLDVSGIVERGEATGHAHRLIGGEVWEAGEYLRSNGMSQLVHDEHDTIVLPEGEYRVIRQRELTPEGDWGYVHD